MKKIFLLFFILVLFLAGCGDASGGGIDSESIFESETKETEVFPSYETEHSEKSYEVISLKEGLIIKEVGLPKEDATNVFSKKFDEDHYIFTVDRRRECGMVEFCLFDPASGDILSSAFASTEAFPSGTRYTDDGVIFLNSHFDTEKKMTVIECAFLLTFDGEKLLCEEVNISDEEIFPYCDDYITSPDGSIKVKKIIDDTVSHAGVEIIYPSGERKRVLEDIMMDDILPDGSRARIGDVVGYYPIDFISESEFVYHIGGWEWSWGYGIYNISTDEKKEFFEGYGCLGTDAEGNIYIGEVDAYRYKNIWQVTPEGEKNRIATVMEDGESTNFKLYGNNLDVDFKNGMFFVYSYDYGVIGGDESSRKTVSIYSADFSELVAKINLIGEDSSSDVIYKNGVVTVVSCFDKEKTNG